MITEILRLLRSFTFSFLNVHILMVIKYKYEHVWYVEFPWIFDLINENKMFACVYGQVLSFIINIMCKDGWVKTCYDNVEPFIVLFQYFFV